MATITIGRTETPDGDPAIALARGSAGEPQHWLVTLEPPVAKPVGAVLEVLGDDWRERWVRIQPIWDVATNFVLNGAIVERNGRRVTVLRGQPFGEAEDELPIDDLFALVIADLLLERRSER